MATLNFDTFTCIANFALLETQPLARASKPLYSFWNEAIPKSSQLLSKYIQLLLEKLKELEKITEQLQRFKGSSYPTTFKLALSPNQFSSRSLEAVSKKFPNLQKITYKRPAQLQVCAPLRLLVAAFTTMPLACTTKFAAKGFTFFIKGASCIAPSATAARLVTIQKETDDALQAFFFNTLRFKNELIRDFYLERTCKFFPKIQHLKISVTELDRSQNFVSSFLDSFSIPALVSVQKLSITSACLTSSGNKSSVNLTGFWGLIEEHFLSQLPHLTHLRCSHVNIIHHKDFDVFVKQLPQKLKKLTLSGIDPQCALSNLLAKCQNLVSLSLKDSQGLFVPGIATHTTIRELKIDKQGQESYYKEIFTILPKLEKLKIRSHFSNEDVLHCPSSFMLKKLTLAVGIFTEDIFSEHVRQFISKVFEHYPALQTVIFRFKKHFKNDYTPGLPDGFTFSKTIRKNGYVILKVTRDICKLMQQLTIHM